MKTDYLISRARVAQADLADGSLSRIDLPAALDTPTPVSPLAEPTGVRVAYLLNQYPQPSQTFIRREIAALETRGLAVERFTLRRWPGTLVDPDDLAERRRTRAVLAVGAVGLCWAVLRTLLSRPRRLLRAAALAWRLGRQSDRAAWLHGVYLAEACVLLRWWAEANIDHVHAHFGTNATAVALLARALGGPRYSFTVHGPEEFDHPQALQLGAKIAEADFAVAISQYGRSQLYRWAEHEHWHKIHVLRCGLDAAFLQTRPVGPVAAPRLVCVARLEEQKGTLLLVEAAGELARRGLVFTLTLVGDGRMRGQIEALIEKLRLQNVVRLVGWQSSAAVREELLQSRALVLPSFAEGLPVVIMEAFALHRPVVATYVGGIAELVQPGVSGWLIPPGAREPLVAAMLEALTAPPELLRDWGAAGAAAVMRQHNAATEAAHLNDLFCASGADSAAENSAPRRRRA
jgi:colanic acid/amylovoran biosynthesis glycosyltransferase